MARVFDGDDGDRPWERLSGERARAHEAFRVFRDLGPADRQLATVAEALEVSPRAVRG